MVGSQRNRWKLNPLERIDWGHRCVVCGLPGFPSDFGGGKGGRYRICTECIRYIREMGEGLRERGGDVVIQKHRESSYRDVRTLKEQALCWRHMDSQMTEGEWDELCDREAGEIAPWEKARSRKRSGGETLRGVAEGECGGED